MSMPASRSITDLLDADFLASMDSLEVISRKILQGKVQGERRSRRRGQSVEFAGHRPYVAGDDLRHMDWNILGRLDQLFLKLFLQEQDLSLRIVTDFSASMEGGDPPKFQFARKLSAALAYLGLVNNDRVTVDIFGDGIRCELSALRGRPCLAPLAQMLLSAPTGGPTDFDKTCRQVAQGTVAPGILIVVSDFLFKDDYRTSLLRLIARRYDLYVIQVLSPQDLEPDFRGNLKLLDVEDGDQADVAVTDELVNAYKRSLDTHCGELREFCAQRGANYLLANTAQPAESLVLDHLRRRGLLA